MSEKDQANTLAMIDAAEKILRFSEEFADSDAFYRDEKSFDAVLMNFVVFGEAASKLSASLTSSYIAIPWSKIKGLRNIVAHNYFGVDAEEIWEIIQKDIPRFIVQLKEITHPT